MLELTTDTLLNRIDPFLCSLTPFSCLVTSPAMLSKLLALMSKRIWAGSASTLLRDKLSQSLESQMHSFFQGPTAPAIR